MNLSINSFADLKMLEGCVISASSFYQITKEKIDIYKKSMLLGDSQDYDSGELIDFFIISMTPYLCRQIVDDANIRMIANYGFDKVIFINKVRIGEHVRLIANINSVKKISGITEIVIEFNIEIKERRIKAIDGKAIFLVSLSKE